jgi:hypothetical protein
MRHITEPPWRVAHALDLDPEERDCAGLVVIAGPARAATLIADCRSDGLPWAEQRANASLCARAPAMAQALIDLEERLGDLPASKGADEIYSIVVAVLRNIGVQPRYERED